MPRKDSLDTFGIVAMTGFAALFAFNQVVIKVTNDGFQPVFLASVRSFGAIFCVLAWMKFRNLPITIAPGTIRAGLLVGVLFSIEFVFLFLALDLTTVARSSVILYSMPVWLTLSAHFLLPGERMTPLKATGLTLAFAGVAWAILGQKEGPGTASFWGDIFALFAAWGWTGIALCVRISALRHVRAETQLLWQVVISAPILLILAMFFGPFLRDPELIHWAGMAFQIVVVVSAGFIVWLWMLSIYPAASVASFSFLSPVIGVFLGWLLLDEEISGVIIAALTLVCGGLYLINRSKRA
ncbi:MAG: drug/metabolite transporter (DMT)-like permease [Paracoccaceae bacterium]|jgi:drug/metabolite transporter (DMT)-like permease